jgi:hypothetical protein
MRIVTRRVTGTGQRGEANTKNGKNDEQTQTQDLRQRVAARASPQGLILKDGGSGYRRKTHGNAPRWLFEGKSISRELFPNY